MPAVEVVLLVAAALTAGTVDAIAGGGGLITLPMLLALGLPPHQALATNKGQSVFGSGGALATYWSHGQIDPSKVALTFPLGALGSLVGAVILLAVPPAVMRPIVITLLIAAAVVLVTRKPVRAPAAQTPRRLALAAGLALVVGVYDGFFGPGTGTFLIVGFVVLCGETLTAATADAKVVNFASNAAAVALFASRGHVVWSVALPMAAAQFAGGLIGARLAVRGGARVVRAATVTVSAALVVKLAYDAYLAS